MNATDLACLPILTIVLAMSTPGHGVRGQLLQAHDKSWASYNCARAATHVEKLICGDISLSEADGRLDFSYQLLLRHAPATERARIAARQRTWLKQRNLCVDKRCVEDAYGARDTAIGAELERWDRILRRPVSRIGRCQTTKIEYIGPRLGNVPSLGDQPGDDGTSVGFSNGVGLVSYDYVRPVARSRIGDPVRVCLVSIPKNCPPGDDRGRFYAVSNLRTGGRWQMPDSQHMCGGA